MITPDALPSNLQHFKHRIWEIEEKYGLHERYVNGWGIGKIHLSEKTPKKVKTEYENLKKKVENYQEPDEAFFKRSDALYKLWVNRDCEEPITFKMLYDVVAEVSYAIREAEANASYSNYDGR